MSLRFGREEERREEEEGEGEGEGEEVGGGEKKEGKEEKDKEKEIESGKLGIISYGYTYPISRTSENFFIGLCLSGRLGR